MNRIDYTQYVNPNIGTIGHLLQATAPCVQSPHGCAVVRPAFRPGVKDVYISDKIFGFNAGAATIMPTVCSGEPEYYATASGFDHDFEVARPDYYSVLLEDTDIREQHTAEHFASYYNVPADTVSMVRYSSDENNSLNQFYNFCKNNSLSSKENYEYAKTVLNMESFADWIILQAYIKNIDIYENVRFYQSGADGQWYLALSDLDMGFMSTGSGFSELQNTFHHGLMVRSLMSNTEFQELLARRQNFWLSGPLSDENMLKTIDEMAAHIANEAVYEQQRWHTPVSGWEAVVKDMKRYCTGHAERMRNDFCLVMNWSRDQLDACGEE